MTMLALISQNKNIKRHKVITTIGSEEKSVALEKFKMYQESGVIHNEFNEDRWLLNDEKDSVTLDFNFNELYIKKYMDNYTTTEFKDILKCYMSFCIGQYIIGTLRLILHNIKELLYNTECLTKMPKKRSILSKTGMQDFIELMPFGKEDIILEVERYRSECVKRRELAEYQSYFLFGKLLDEFWGNKASDYEKTYYYPIYLWWNIAMILPVRVTEFTLIPKECIDIKQEVKYLKIRRSKLKGSTKKEVSYKIDEDYKIYDYAIPDNIERMIFEYKELVKGYKESSIDSLFVDEIYLNGNNVNDRGFFHVNQFSRVLDDFYCDVIEKYYNYEVIPKDKLKETSFDGESYKIKENEIVRISLGDSRHIAMQNMLLNGCNILMAKEITGHESANMIFHYSGNMKNLIKCKAYSLFEMSKRKEIIVESLVGNGKNYTIFGDVLANFVEVDDGKCFSPFFTKGDMKDCYTVEGDCERCDYAQSNKSRKELIKKQETKVEEILKRLVKWIYSEKNYRNTDEYKIWTRQLQAGAENLKNAYVEGMKRGNING